MYMIQKNNNSFLLSRIGSKKTPKLGIEPGIFGFIEVKYKCPRFDPHGPCQEVFNF